MPADIRDENHEAIRALSFLGAFFFLVAVIGYLLTASWSPEIPRDGTSLVVGRDFLNFWMYGRAAPTADPSRFYDVTEYNRALQALLGAGYPGLNRSYPPSIFFLAAPFGQLGYLTALLLWTLLGSAIFFAVARRHIAAKEWQSRAALLLRPPRGWRYLPPDLDAIRPGATTRDFGSVTRVAARAVQALV